MKKIFIFDLDNTLTESRTKIDALTAALLCGLLKKAKVAVISGASFKQFERQLIAGLPCENLFGSLFIIPTNGAELWEFASDDKKWKCLYSYPMPEDSRKEIIAAIAKDAKIPTARVEDFIADLGTQVTYSALGIEAPIEEKKKYAPDEKKRRDFAAKIAPRFPEFSFEIAGRTSINVIVKGKDKAFGIENLLARTGIAASDALFVGDALYEGGNDEKAKAAGEEVIATSGPEETRKIIKKYLYEK